MSRICGTHGDMVVLFVFCFHNRAAGKVDFPRGGSGNAEVFMAKLLRIPTHRCPLRLFAIFIDCQMANTCPLIRSWPHGHLATWPLGLTLPVRGHKPKSLVRTGPESRSNCQKKGTESKWGAGPAKSVNRQFQLFYRLRTEWPNEPGQMSMPSVYVRMEITVGKLFQKNTVLSLKNDICNNIYLKTNIKHDCFPLKE